AGLAAHEAMLLRRDAPHNACKESITALGATLSRITGPVLTLLLGRPELGRGPRRLAALPDAEVAPLPPLRGADASRLLSAFLGGGRLPRSDEDQLLTTAQGDRKSVV